MKIETKRCVGSNLAGGGITCRACECESEGPAGDVNCRVYNSFVNNKGETVGFSRVPGHLQKGHLSDRSKRLDQEACTKTHLNLG